MQYSHVGGVGIEAPEKPYDFSAVVRAQIDSWVANLEVLSKDPRVRRFTELREELFAADLSSVGPPGDGGILGRRKGLPFLDNELSAFKADDLKDVVFPARRGPG
jgi:hypothetical protein